MIVNGWQQGWVLPAGQRGTVTLSFPSNAAYRTGLAAGLCLLPCCWRWRWCRNDDGLHLRPGATVVTGSARSGWPAAGRRRGDRRGRRGGGVRHRSAPRRRDAPPATAVRPAALLSVPAGLILAGALLSRYPWRSTDGYIGPPWVQLPALIALAALAASLLPCRRPAGHGSPNEPTRR